MAICRFYGPPALFITFTCNPKWQKIADALAFIPGQRPDARPDIVSRVFKLKVEELVSELKKGTYFGKAQAVLYTVEFRKRGLPHVHILVWLEVCCRSKIWTRERASLGSQHQKVCTARVPWSRIQL
ncbi:unnamed protein product [Urochloa humidicola]